MREARMRGGPSLFLLLFAAACASTRPSIDASFAPIAASSPADALQQLFARRTSFTGARSLMRVRATTGGSTQTFRAQLQVDNGGRMLLIAYTPIGTTAATLYAEGDQVTLHNVDGTVWHGSARDLGAQFGILGSVLTPADVALLILGLPPTRDGATYEATSGGLSSAAAGPIAVTFDPPSYPPAHVVVTRGNDRLEIDHLEMGSTTERVASGG